MKLYENDLLQELFAIILDTCEIDSLNQVCIDVQKLINNVDVGYDLGLSRNDIFMHKM